MIISKKLPFSNILGWSASRQDIFTTCKRKYYYQYYGKYDTEYSYSKINFLKQLTSISLTQGYIVHELVKTLLERLCKSTEPIDSKRFKNYVVNLTHNYCKTHNFEEVYYKKQKYIDVETDILPKVIISLDNMLNSERFDWLISIAFNTASQWIIEPDEFGEARINDLKVYCKVDLLISVDGKIYIFDWKTGKPNKEKNQKQMLGYAVWAADYFDVTPNKILPIIAYVYPNYSEVEVIITDTIQEKFTCQINEYTNKMYDYCINIEKNLPKHKDFFKQTDKEILCQYCCFKELCFK